MKLKIAICCCSYLFGEGIKSIVEKYKKEHKLNITIVLNCFDPKTINIEKPDLLITDFNTLSDMFHEDFFHDKLRVLLLGTRCLPIIEDGSLANFISHGLVGILSPDTSESQFSKALNTIISGELWFERKRLQGAVPGSNSAISKKIPHLTEKEIEIVKLICEGLSNKEIKKSLKITEQSVRAHLSRIYKKTGVSDRLQLALLAVNTIQFY
ncbi:MAG: response regulator transcription factor [Candidatus Brocadiales bacterium]|nr:response regulator transcription factor [Candidatus Brocadiales bacterium]